MSDAPALVYLEADDEITAVIRRVRAAGPGRVIVVAPGRSRATSSAVALRLLARGGDEDGREVVVVGDALTRSLAAEAGLPAFASVDEARSASLEPGTATTEEPRHATIHVVRRAASDDTVATPMAAAAPATSGPMEETRAVPVQRRPAGVVPSRVGSRRRRPSLGLAVVLGTAAALLVAGIVAGATLLPAATVTIAPRPVPVRASYELIVEEPVRHSGTVEARATVTATETYEILERATGVVTFRNFNIGTVEVPARTLVAAGEQAFETTEAVDVPSGSLTADGRIAAGEQDAPVVAVAAGPAANVGADAIDTVLSQNVRARLRGFPQNDARLVTNAEPTSGGIDASGPRISEADVDAAIEGLVAELRRLAAEARPDVGDLHVVEDSTGEPRIEVPEDLPGTRDQPETGIAGSLSWSLVAVDLDALEDEASARMESDPDLPADHDLLQDTVRVELGDPILDGDVVIVEATVQAATAPRIDEGSVLERIIGRSEAEAELALADIGEADVALWPGWVESVPELDWRVEVRIEALAP